jgi:hypothetical protein
MKIQINDSNYAHYKKIFEVLYTYVFKPSLPVEMLEHDGIAKLDKWEMESSTKAKRGLKSALHDLISQSGHVPVDIRLKINEELSRQQLPSLEELSDANARIIARVIKRKAIKTQEEFYLITEELGNVDGNLTLDNRKVLEAALFKFETSSTKNP